MTNPETYDERIKRQWAEADADYKRRIEACTRHYWRWDRSRCEVCGMELSDYIPKLEHLLDDLVEYATPCDKDEGRDYCMTHHEFKCPANELVLKTRELLDKVNHE